MTKYINDALLITLEAEREREVATGETGQPWIPPQLPSAFQAFVLAGIEGNDYKWKRVNHAESNQRETLPDPVLAQHQERFNRIFERLEAALNTPIVREEYPNHYYEPDYNREPWYEFNLGSAHFIVGPRHRVDTIYVESEQPFDVKDIRRQTVEVDQVTYFKDGQWKGKGDTATQLEVHAWTDDKVVEYINLISQQFLTTSVAG